jgi:hypothetical protein
MQDDPRELFKRIIALEDLQIHLRERMAELEGDEEGQRMTNWLIARAFKPRCLWDRRNRVNLLTLATSPTQAPWLFRMADRIHSLIHPQAD